MHELSSATVVVRTAVGVAAERGASRVTRVKLQIGELTLLNPDQLRFCFGVASKGTLAEGAELDVEIGPAVLACQSCGSRFRWTAPYDDPASHLYTPRLSCSCGSSDLKTISGRELKIISVTVQQ